MAQDTMPLDLLAALVGFAFVTSITPGPNNLMLLASGVNYGVRRTVPHMLGISLGHAFMVFLVGLGLAELFDRLTWSRTALAVASILYVGWLALKIATAAPSEGVRGRGKPFTFLQAAAFQWVNPKAWVMALYAVTAYAARHDWLSVLVVALVFAAVNLPSVSVWAVAGQEMRRFLDDPRRLRIFNITMAVLLVASLVPLVAELA